MYQMFMMFLRERSKKHKSKQTKNSNIGYLRRRKWLSNLHIMIYIVISCPSDMVEERLTVQEAVEALDTPSVEEWLYYINF